MSTKNDKKPPQLEMLRSHTTLSSAERERSRGALIAFIENHRGTESASVPATAPINWFSHNMMRVGAWGMVIALTLGGSTLGASASAIPGDLLYPVKVNVTEEIGYLFAWSPQTRTQLSKERLSRRLAEIALLHSYPTVNALEDASLLREETAQAMEQVVEDIEDLVEDDLEVTAAVTADELLSSANTYEDIIRRSGVVQPDHEETLLQLSEVLEAMEDLHTRASAQALEESDQTENLAETLDAVEDAHDDLAETLERLTSATPNDSAVDALSEAERDLTEASDALNASDSAKALSALDEAREIIEEVEAAIELSDLSSTPLQFNGEPTDPDDV